MILIILCLYDHNSISANIILGLPSIQRVDRHRSFLFFSFFFFFLREDISKTVTVLSWAEIRGPRVAVSLRAQHEPKSFPSYPRRLAAGAAAPGGARMAGFAVPSPSPGLPPPPAAPLLHRAACRRATATPFDCSTQCQGWPGGAEEEPLLRCLRRRAQGVRRNGRESLVQFWSVATSAVEDLDGGESDNSASAS